MMATDGLNEATPDEQPKPAPSQDPAEGAREALPEEVKPPEADAPGTEEGK